MMNTFKLYLYEPEKTFSDTNSSSKSEINRSSTKKDPVENSRV